VTKQRLSLSSIQQEFEELQKDREAFVRSLDIMRSRVDESLNSTRSYPPLHKWSGARAVIGSLEMAVSHIERNLSEYSEAIRMIREGVIEDADDSDRPKFGVLEGGEST